jgi:hypothetical protein
VSAPSGSQQSIDHTLERHRRRRDRQRNANYEESIVRALRSPELSSGEAAALRQVARLRRDSVCLLARRQEAAFWMSLDDLRHVRTRLTRYLIASVLVVVAAVVAVLALVALSLQQPLLGGSVTVVTTIVLVVAILFRADVGERIRSTRDRLGLPGWRELRSRTAFAEDLVSTRHDEWREALYQGLMPHLREHLAEAVPGTRFDRANGQAPGLQQPFEVAFHVATATGKRLVCLLRDLEGGSLALAGARGTGKTGLIEAIVNGYYAEDGVVPGVTVVMPAPVQYEPRDFVLQLFAAACERTVEFAARHVPRVPISAYQLRELRRTARTHLKTIRYEQTVSVHAAPASPWMQFAYARGYVRRPLTYPEIVHQFREFVQMVSTALVDLDMAEGREPMAVPVLIAIDELDRMGSAENARTFLNEVKGAFSIKGCRFIVSVADETMQTFELAGTPLDVVVDRAFDEVVHMDYLDFETVRRLLIRRVAPPFREAHVALCYCLSGGIARDVVRTARVVAGVGRAVPPPGPERDDLEGIAAELVLHEMQNAVRWARSMLLRAGIEPAATNTIRWLDPWWDVSDSDHALLRTELMRTVGYRLPAGTPSEIRPVAERLLTLGYFLLTVMDVFCDDLDHDPRVLDAGQLRAFGVLTRSRRALRANDLLARTLLEQFREAWRLPAIPQATR